MPNTREKLIELVSEIRRKTTAWHTTEDIADMLIANGVTVQKWIPVTERLPKEKGFYLTARKRDVFVEQWNGVWFSERCHYAQPTHWMPLPEAPKETIENR